MFNIGWPSLRLVGVFLLANSKDINRISNGFCNIGLVKAYALPENRALSRDSIRQGGALFGKNLQHSKRSFQSNEFEPPFQNQQKRKESSVDLSMSGGGEASTAPKILLQELLAEMLGTFIIVHIGCGAVCAETFLSAQIGLWQVAVVWSIAVTVAITTVGSISGAHFNPAITLCFALFRNFSWIKVLPYAISQLVGAFLACVINFVLYQGSIVSFEAANEIVRGAAASTASAQAFGNYFSITALSAVLAEGVGTALLAFVVFALTNPKNKESSGERAMLTPLIIGATVGSIISMIAPLTQCGLNPARDFGPRLVTSIFGWGKAVSFKGWWVYVLGPMIGGPLGAFLAEKVVYQEE